jgi:hypothetical protein
MLVHLPPPRLHTRSAIADLNRAYVTSPYHVVLLYGGTHTIKCFLYDVKCVNHGFRILGFCGDFHAVRQGIMTFRVRWIKI